MLVSPSSSQPGVKFSPGMLFLDSVRLATLLPKVGHSGLALFVISGRSDTCVTLQFASYCGSVMQSVTSNTILTVHG